MYSTVADRGKEFTQVSQLRHDLLAPVYFYLPPHPWQKDTNENTNGLLRSFFPKGKSLDTVTRKDVDRVYASSTIGHANA